MSKEIGLFEAINTLRSIRRFKPIPVKDEKIRLILEAATKAPSGGNSQPWEFIVIKDPEIKRKLRDYVAKGCKIYLESRLYRLPPEMEAKVLKLAEETDKVPVLILVCLNTQRARRVKNQWIWIEEMGNYGSIFPAVQNILLAARGLGLGTCISMFHLFYEYEVKQLLKIPDHVKPLALINVGYPVGKFSPPKRLPVDQFIHYDGW